ncbi:MAG: transcriptional repressor LexA [Clostridia bacterium]|nr:transcriptional repressor LexA [Clostridia bacterium]
MARSGHDTHEKIYAYLQHCAGNTFPTVREIASACGIKSTSCVHKHLLLLEQEGRIVRKEGQSRSASVQHQPAAMVPVVGRVTAGVPITAVELIEDYIPLPAHMSREGETFALRVVGDSMKNAGILDGDLVICHQTADANNGEIVVAMLDGEATVKRFFRYRDKVVLQPENPAYEPIVSRNVILLGRVAAVIRSYL